MNIKNKKKSKNKSANISFIGLYITGIIMCVIVMVLCVVQNSVPYEIREQSIQLIPKDEIRQAKLNYKKLDDADYAIIYEEDDEASNNALNLIRPVLDQMKIAYDLYTTDEMNTDALKKYRYVVIDVYHYQNMTEYINDIKMWVRQGGNLMALIPPELNGSFMSFADIYGIKEGGENILVNEIEIVDDFLISGNTKVYPITDAFESSIAVNLANDCKVFMKSTDKYPVPIIWRRNYGEGSVVFDNFGIFEKSYRGIHAAATSLLGDSFIYPVINGSTFYIDDFPSPVPEGDAQFISRDYNMSVSEFYSQVWWNNVYDLCKKHNIKYTGLVIENYSNQVSGTWERNEDVERYSYFGNMLLKKGGEIGIHGYNHMPLVLENFDYQDLYDEYVQWPTKGDIRNSLDEVIDFTNGLFPEEDIKVYVPPSNILSEEGIEVLDDLGIDNIASVYLEGDLGYAQEFEVSYKNGIVNTPRVISGYIFNDYVKLTALSELNFHFVNTHFQHPDDVLDVDRGAELGWQEMYSRFSSYTDWLYDATPDIRNLTGSELAAAVERYDVLEMKRDFSESEMKVSLDNYYNEAYMLLRLNNGQNIEDIAGAKYVEVAKDLYLVDCTSEQVDIYFSKEN